MVMCQVGEGLAVREVGAPPPDRGQITGTILHLLGAAAARPQLPSRASGELAHEVDAELSPPCPRGVAKTNGCRSTGRCVGRGCDVSESGPGRRSDV